MAEPLAEIRAACACLKEERYEAAVELLDQAGVDGAAVEAIRATALGLIAERAGKPAEAESYLGRAFTLGVPLSALLHQLGDYFKRHAQLARAQHCYSLLENYEAMPHPFREGLNATQRARYAPWIVRWLASRPRPQHWFYPPVKEALVSELGVEAAALAFAGMAGNELGELRTLPLRSLREHGREAGHTYEELIQAREVRLPPMPVFGDHSREGFQACARTLFLTTLQDVVVSSKSNLLLTDDAALLDYQDDEPDRVPVDYYVDPVVFQATDQRLTVMVEAGAVSGTPLKRALSLVGVNSYNFGHWLIEFLPKAWACREHPGFETVPILIDEQMPEQNRQALQLFVGRDHPIITLKRGAAVRVKELWACSTVGYVPIAAEVGPTATTDLLVLDSSFADIVARVRLDFAGADEYGERLYLARQDTQHRRLVNRSEVEEWFRGEGFEIVDFGRLPFAEQLERIQRADVVVGPDGSSLMMTLFAHPGTRIGVLDNPYLQDNAWYVLVSESLGQRIRYLCGEVVERHFDYDYQSGYAIDVDALPGFLEELTTE